MSTNFNPRSPWGERLNSMVPEGLRFLFQSTLPVGGATWYNQKGRSQNNISIHAPRGGSDKISLRHTKSIKDFNPRSPWGERPPGYGLVFVGLKISIHAPRGGSDDLNSSKELNPILFQSTLPVGGSDFPGRGRETIRINFNPRSPWGERLSRNLFKIVPGNISIHAPRGGSDGV